jgi:hypothetical protein
MMRFAKSVGVWLVLLLAYVTAGGNDGKPSPTDAALAAAHHYYLLGEYGKAEHE